jgi:hypothetical protein
MCESRLELHTSPKYTSSLQKKSFPERNKKKLLNTHSFYLSIDLSVSFLSLSIHQTNSLENQIPN